MSVYKLYFYLYKTTEKKWNSFSRIVVALSWGDIFSRQQNENDARN